MTRSPSPPRRAALYLRSSKDRADVSIEAQRRQLTEDAQKRGWTVATEFVDAVESGKDDDRPGFRALIAAIRNVRRGWDAVMALDTSRVARRRHIALIFETECERHGVAVSYRNVPETEPITEMLLKSVLQAMDEWHSLTSKQKGLAGMATNVRAGFRAGGRAPVGYRLAKRTTGAIREGELVAKSVLELDPETAPAVQAFFAARADGHGRVAAAERAGIGHLAKSSLVGLEWNALTYAGHTVWNVTSERASGGGYIGGVKRRPRQDWVIQRDTHPALVDEETAERLLAALERGSAAKGKGQRKRVSDALLGGLLFAPDGSKWWSEADRYRWVKDGEQRSVPRGAVDRTIVDRVLADLRTSDFVAEAIAATRALSEPAGDASRINALRREVADLARRAERAMELAAAEDMPDLGMRTAKTLEARRAVLAEELAQLEQSRQEADALDEISERQVHAFVASVAEALEYSSPSAARDLINAVVERVELDPETTEATLHYRVASSAISGASPGSSVASPRGFEPRSPP